MMIFLLARPGYFVASLSGSHFGGSAAWAAGTVPRIMAELPRTTATAKSNLDRTIARPALIAALFPSPESPARWSRRRDIPHTGASKLQAKQRRWSAWQSLWHAGCTAVRGLHRSA